MKNDRNRRARGRARAPHEIDAPNLAEPDSFFFNNRPSRSDHKVRQLCRQVFRTLNMGLDVSGDDPVLRDLAVHSVLPAPNASRLLVNVYSTDAAAPAAPHVILGRLHRATPRLRAEVAHAIVRKRAPELVFNVVPGAGEVPSWQ